MSRHDKRPAFSAQWFNDSDQNAIAPDGQLAPPHELIYMPGMTMRQHYAGLALQGYLASMKPCPECGPIEPPEFARAIGRDCWIMADALIATEYSTPSQDPIRAQLVEALRGMLEYAGIIEERADAVATDAARKALAAAEADQ